MNEEQGLTLEAFLQAKQGLMGVSARQMIDERLVELLWREGVFGPTEECILWGHESNGDGKCKRCSYLFHEEPRRASRVARKVRRG